MLMLTVCELIEKDGGNEVIEVIEEYLRKIEMCKTINPSYVEDKAPDIRAQKGKYEINIRHAMERPLGAMLHQPCFVIRVSYIPNTWIYKCYRKEFGYAY